MTKTASAPVKAKTVKAKAAKKDSPVKAKATKKDSPVKAKAAKKDSSGAASAEELLVITEVSTVLSQFFRKSLCWVGGDDALEYSSADLSLVQAQSYCSPFNGSETLVIRLISGVPFTLDFVSKFKAGALKTIVNTIVAASNAWLEATNSNEVPLVHQQAVDELLSLTLGPEVEEINKDWTGTNPDEEEYKTNTKVGAIGISRESGSRIERRWDYTVNFQDWCAIDNDEKFVHRYKNTKGTCRGPLALVE